MAERKNRFRVGNLDLVILSDGVFYQDAGAVFGVVPRTAWERYARDRLDDQHRIPLGLNSVLVRSEGRTILIETGVGDKERIRAQSSPLAEGNLLAELSAQGVQPQDVDVVINTHLHADHCGWNTRYLPANEPGGEKKLVATFPRARYLLQRGEWQAATHPNERTRATYLAENLLPVEESGQLELIDGEESVTGEITVIPSPGHTADHASVVIVSGGETALYVGDIAQHEVQLERPAWIAAFDVLPLVSLETKKRLMERAVRENALVVSVHCPFPGVGRMTLTGEGRRKWVPA